MEWLPIVGFLLFDFVSYWTHRFYHEIPVLWKFHAIHHSTEHLDWVSGFRAHPFDGTLIAPAFAFLIAAGFSPEITGVFAIFQIVLGLLLHANVRFRFRWLHPFLGTPEMHHWHHSNEKEAIWTNYGAAIPLWDQVFGTYYMPKDKRWRETIYFDGFSAQVINHLHRRLHPSWTEYYPFHLLHQVPVEFQSGFDRAEWMSDNVERIANTFQRIHDLVNHIWLNVFIHTVYTRALVLWHVVSPENLVPEWNGYQLLVSYCLISLVTGHTDSIMRSRYYGNSMQYITQQNI